MLKWIYGPNAWRDGVIDVNNTLPVIRGKDTFMRDIHSEEEITLSISKRDLPDPANWKQEIKVGQTLVALVDDENPDYPTVLMAGVVTKASGRVGETIEIRVGGMLEYLAGRVISTVYTGNVENPTVTVDFKSNTYQGAILKVIQHAFIQQGGSKTPPTYVTFPYIPDGELGITVNNSEFMRYSDAIDELKEAGTGNEVSFIWGWANVGQLQLQVEVEPDYQPQRNSNQTLPMVIDNEQYRVSSFSENQSIAGYANRIIAQSKSGDEEAQNGSDFQVRISNDNIPEALWDQTFNPGVELTQAQMNEQLNSRLGFIKTPQGTSEIEVAGDMLEWLSNLGKHLDISGGEHIDSAGYGGQVRIVSVSITPSNKKVKISIMPLSAKYPKLPKASNMFKPGFAGGVGSAPIMPRMPGNFPGYKGGAGGGGGGGTPEIDEPTFDGDKVWGKTTPLLTYVKHDGVGSDSYYGAAAAQQGDHIYMLNGGFVWPDGGGFEVGYVNHFTDDECADAHLNAMQRLNNEELVLSRITAVDDGNSGSIENLFTLKLSDYIYEFDFICERPRNLGPHTCNHNGGQKTYLFIDGENVWVLIIRALTVDGTYSALFPSSFRGIGTILLKNNINTGNSGSWEIVARNMANAEGNVVFPTSRVSCMAAKGNLYFFSHAASPAGVNTFYISATDHLQIRPWKENNNTVQSYADTIRINGNNGSVSNLGLLASFNPVSTDYPDFPGAPGGELGSIIAVMPNPQLGNRIPWAKLPIGRGSANTDLERNFQVGYFPKGTNAGSKIAETAKKSGNVTSITANVLSCGEWVVYADREANKAYRTKNSGGGFIESPLFENDAYYSTWENVQLPFWKTQRDPYVPYGRNIIQREAQFFSNNGFVFVIAGSDLMCYKFNE